MFANLLKNIAWGVVRHTLTAAGGSMVMDGWVTADENQQLIGALMTILGIAWSAWQKHKTHKVIKSANAVITAEQEAKNAAILSKPSWQPETVSTSDSNDLTGATAKITPVEVRTLAPIQ